MRSLLLPMLRSLPVCLLLTALPAGAGQAADPAPAGGMPAMPMQAGSQDAADQAMTAGMRRMKRQMADAPLTGNADRDFVAMMTPHHVGAIDMARTELRYGTDPELRRLARSIVAAQEREVAQMQAWTAAHPAN